MKKDDNIDVRLASTVKSNQEKMKKNFDRRASPTTIELKVGDWVLFKKPYKVRKGESVFSDPVLVCKMSKGAAFLQGKG